MKRKKITPFIPRAFPPRHLNSQSFLPSLKKAKEALKKCSNALQQSPIPKQIKDALLHIEATNSLETFEMDSSPINDYLRALKIASKQKTSEPFTKKQICAIHRAVKQHTSAKNDLGKYRTRQNWIGPAGCSIDEAYFYPPASKKLETLMNELLNYMNQRKREPLLQLALTFGQLLLIHPFMDGNGRVTRILAGRFLFKSKLLPEPIFFLSSYLKKNKLKYYRAAYNITDENDWEGWICFFLKAIIQSVADYTAYKKKKPRDLSISRLKS